MAIVPAIPAVLCTLTPDGQLPSRKHVQDAGADLHSSETRTIQPHTSELIQTGVCMAIPPGYEGQVRPRSGLANKHAVTVLNAPGTIDAQYRGPVGVILINHGTKPFVINKGDRIAQLVIAKVELITFTRVDTLEDTDRGDGGFGSTGK